MSTWSNRKELALSPAAGRDLGQSVIRHAGPKAERRRQRVGELGELGSLPLLAVVGLVVDVEVPLALPAVGDVQAKQLVEEGGKLRTHRRGVERRPGPASQQWVRGVGEQPRRDVAVAQVRREVAGHGRAVHLAGRAIDPRQRPQPCRADVVRGPEAVVLVGQRRAVGGRVGQRAGDAQHGDPDAHGERRAQAGAGPAEVVDGQPDRHAHRRRRVARPPRVAGIVNDERAGVQSGRGVGRYVHAHVERIGARRQYGRAR